MTTISYAAGSTAVAFDAEDGDLSLQREGDYIYIIQGGVRVARYTSVGTGLQVDTPEPDENWIGLGFAPPGQFSIGFVGGPIVFLWSIVPGTGAGDTMAGTDVDDILVGMDGHDHLEGGDGNDLLDGGAGDDELKGDGGQDDPGPGGDDILLGGNGSDILRGGGGRDYFDGGDGFDRIYFDFRAATQGVLADLATGIISNDGFGNAETMVSIEGLGPGTAFSDTYIGNGDANFFEGGFGDIVHGHGGDDHIHVSGAPSLIDGGANFDRISFGGSPALIPDSNSDGLAEVIFAPHGVNVDLGLGTIIDDGFGRSGTIVSIEQVTGSDFGDRIVGNFDNNFLAGNGGNDQIAGAAGADHLEGGDGNDLLDGGADFDTVGFQFMPGPGSLSLEREGQFLVVYRDGETVASISVNGATVRVQGVNSGSHLGGDDLVNVERLNFQIAGSPQLLQVNVSTGGPGGNTLNGSDANDILLGLGGNDTLTGNGGHDYLEGGEGNDTLRGDGGSTYNGPSGDDSLVGAGGDDLLTGGAGIDGFDGGAGIDRVSFFFRTATQGVHADLSTQTIKNDGFGNSETMVSIEGLGGGTAFADTFIGDDNANTLLGDLGDTIIGNGGDDQIQLGGAPALIDGGTGIDTITGFFGAFGVLVPDGADADSLADVIFPSHGVNVDLGANAIIDDGFGFSGTILNVENVGGSQFGDRLVGNSLANVLDGGAGDDLLDGRGGDDDLSGSTGLDTLIGGGGSDTIHGGADNDTLLGGFSSSHLPQPGDSGDILHGEGGNDLIRGGDGDDSLFGGEGADNLRGDAGSDLLDGGAGEDFASFWFSALGSGINFDLSSVDPTIETTVTDPLGGTDTLRSIERIGVVGTDYDDLITGTGFTLSNQLSGGGGNDVVTGADRADQLYGDDGNDTLSGLDGDDRLQGGNGNDILLGGSGSDILAGGDGFDRMFGGAGTDTFVLGGGTPTPGAARGLAIDVIMDFDGGDDLVFDDATILSSELFGNINAAEKTLGVDLDGLAKQAGDKQFVSVVYGDSNGDGLADFAVALIGVKKFDTSVGIAEVAAFVSDMDRTYMPVDLVFGSM